MRANFLQPTTRAFLKMGDMNRARGQARRSSENEREAGERLSEKVG